MNFGIQPYDTAYRQIYTNNSNITNNQLSNNATIGIGNAADDSNIFGQAINIQGNTFSGTYNNALLALILVCSAGSIQLQQGDPLTNGVAITDNHCNINLPIQQSPSPSSFIYCCTPDPNTQVTINGNTLAAGLFLQTVKVNNPNASLAASN